ncbi:hypothetical protein HK096_010635 [Nowakowskiella sp. JEL0078]|nr:hypothetical protein HK096_010635 [Nowakowskiella sp. JEL0078]
MKSALFCRASCLRLSNEKKQEEHDFLKRLQRFEVREMTKTLKLTFSIVIGALLPALASAACSDLSPTVTLNPACFESITCSQTMGTLTYSNYNCDRNTTTWSYTKYSCGPLIAESTINTNNCNIYALSGSVSCTNTNSLFASATITDVAAYTLITTQSCFTNWVRTFEQVIYFQNGVVNGVSYVAPTSTPTPSKTPSPSTSPTPESGGLSSTAIIAIAVAVGAVIILIIAGVVFRVVLKNKKNLAQQPSTAVNGSLISSNPSAISSHGYNSQPPAGYPVAQYNAPGNVVSGGYGVPGNTQYSGYGGYQGGAGAPVITQPVMMVSGIIPKTNPPSYPNTEFPTIGANRENAYIGK